MWPTFTEERKGLEGRRLAYRQLDSPLREVSLMTRVPDFYSINEVVKPQHDRVYHNNNACAPGRDIPSNERRAGTNAYRLCADCSRLNNEGR